MTGEFSVSARRLAVRYGRREVFHDISFDARSGQAVGVVGENGAGKTTLLRAVVGLIHPAQGEVRIAGLPPQDAIRRIPTAYFAGEATLPGRARARSWSGGLGIRVVTDRRPLRTLSRGARQLVGLQTSLGSPSLGLIVLDEPWEGLDPDGALGTAVTSDAEIESLARAGVLE